MASITAICNLALGWLGANPINSLDDESTEAKLCKANWPVSRDACLEDRAWTFATTDVQLAPLATSPSTNYAYGFKIPTNSIRILRAGGVTDYRDKLQWEKQLNNIVCDSSVLYIKHIVRIEDPQRFSPAFVQAVAAKLSMDMAIAITESKSIFDAMALMYEHKLQSAAATDGMQGRAEKFTADQLTRVR